MPTWPPGPSALGEALASVARTTGALYATRDPERMLANASVYLEAFGHVVVAWIWLEQALAAHGQAGDFYEGKRQACRYFFRWELPRTGRAVRAARQPRRHHARHARCVVLTAAA